MRTARLSDVAAFVRGVTFKPSDTETGGVGVMRTKNVQEHLDLRDIMRIPARLVKRQDQYLHTGDTLISTANSWQVVGKACWVPTLTEPLAIGGFVTALRPDPSVIDPRFLFRYFTAPRTQALLRSFSNQTTSIANLNLKRAGELEVPLPPLEEQRRIAAILDSADALRATCRRVLETLESLAQALFSEARKTSTVRDTALGEVAKFAGGASLPPGEPFVGQSGGSLLMKVSDMNVFGNERTILKAALWTDRAVPAGSTVDAGAVVLPKRGASIATNKKRVVTRRTTLDPNLMGVTPISDQLTSDYLFAWLDAFDLASITSGSSVPQLNKQDLAPLLFPLPSRADQLKFSARVSRVELARTRSQRSLAIAEELFASLQHRAFRGEL